MPVYEYTCRVCDREFEHFHRSVGDTAVPRCPSCGGTRVDRKLSVFAAPQGTPKPCEATAARSCSGCCDASKSCPI